MSIEKKSVRDRIEQALKKIKDQSGFSEASGIPQPSVSRMINGNLGADNLIKALDALGAKITFPGEDSSIRDVKLNINAKVVPAGEGLTPPVSEDYMAVPLVAEVGAGPGMIPQGDLLSWFLVYKHQDALRRHGDLMAVQIGKTSTSMQPTLNPGDIVLINLGDKDTSRPGRIMLVLDPMDGSGMIKRVAVKQRGNDYRITYYSDNAADNPPDVFSWRDDFGKDWSKSIVGHVVWAWSDISNK